MSPMQDDYLLHKTVKTMMSQVCKIALTYCCELLIEGTIGVTIDKQKMIVIHFDDKILPTNNSDIIVPNTSASDASASLSLPDNNMVDNPRQLGAEALASLNSYFSEPVSGATNSGIHGGVNTSSGQGFLKSNGWEAMSSSKMMSCFQVTSANQAALSQTLNETIAIDSDSDSLDGMQFESMSDSGRSRYVGTSSRVSARLMKKSTSNACDMKHIITIKDKELFESGADLDEVMPEDLKSPSQLSVVPQRTLTSVDCESLPDASESRSLFNDISPHGLSSEDFDVKSNFEVTAGSKPTCICEICGRRIPTLCQLEAHLVSKHGIIESIQLGKITHFSCSVCGKRYRFQAQLDKHMVRHEVERPYKCKACRNAYRYEESLLLHVQVHSNRLNCNLCNKTYTNKVLFQKHISYMHEKAKDSKL